MTYQKFSQPASRFAIVGCAVVKHPDGNTKVAFSGVADYAFRDAGVESAASAGASATDAASKAANGKDVMGDHFASSEYRHHLAKVYAKRALEAVA
jgi:aerobic carbon-monoxide dehydrogenase medium subunit